ncbi:winged helix-turn-helix domain-containing protein [Saccharothrix sp. NRRL B-16348]|uniref:winged helix-turn-helix domain-containing protein n=1 Tax=Saccharothrix sp. NRRL B-16348 TaxID=1415542 RepID=UPI001E4F17EE|nr:response regulator transcription factor [Saccharothrix sp. NRRL B-16348]
MEDDRRLAGLLVHGLNAEGFAVDSKCVGSAFALYLLLGGQGIVPPVVVEPEALPEYDGLDGLWWATGYPYKVIRLGLMPPGLNDHRIRRQRWAAKVSTPILKRTAKGGERGQAEGLAHSADDYLTKPFSRPVLVVRLRVPARHGGVPFPTVPRAGDPDSDLAARLRYRRRHPVALTAKEFTMLEFLLRRADRAVPRMEIAARAWDEAGDPDPNLVEVYISILRCKIDTPLRRDTATTVRGYGYRLCCDGGVGA